MPELTNLATGRESRPQEVDKFRDEFQVSGEIQEGAADKETAALLERPPFCAKSHRDFYLQ